MTESSRARADALRTGLSAGAQRVMVGLISGSIDTQAVSVVARLRVPDELALGARTAEDLAGRVGANAAMLRRVLRYLTRRGVFVELEGGRFSLGPAGQLLQSAHPLSLRATAIRAGEELWGVTGRLLTAVQSGRTPHDDEFGASYFDRLADNGTAGALASRMQTGLAEVAAALTTLECVSRAQTIVDVGGSHGHLLARLLAAHPRLRGVLFDLPNVVNDARRLMDDASVLDRCEIVAGNMFDGVPAGDVYLLSWVLHDWNDDRAAAILQRCREAAPAATVLVVEVLLPDRAEIPEHADPIDPFLLDLQMLLLTGGRERTAHEYRDLLAGAGYKTDRVMPVVSPTRGVGVVQASGARRYE